MHYTLSAYLFFLSTFQYKRNDMKLKLSVLSKNWKATTRICILVLLIYFSTKSLLSINNSLMHVRRFQAETESIIEKFDTELIKSSVCTNRKSDCIEKEIIFANSNDIGISIEFYALDNELLEKMLNICVKEYVESNREMEISISIHEETKQERVQKFFWQLPKPSFVTLRSKK